MGEVISQHELRNDSNRIMSEVEEGKTFMVTRNHEPVAELRPLHHKRLVDTRVVLEAFRNAPILGSEEFFHDLDSVVDQDPDPRE